MMMSQSWIVDNLWAMEKEVRPCRASSKACCTTRSLSVSSALVASSNRRTGGSRINARQIATRCFWPPESLEPRGPTSVSQPWLASLSKNSRWHIFFSSRRRCSETVSPAS
mmetsp:Transcript_3666/g.8534  ORF Transcript_3666/g.8534 Transcript_3666/m.8534 type:complete len:111 (+) Transcript_3666:438-770(+)